MQWINSSGEFYYRTNGTALCTQPNDQKFPQICYVGTQGVIITWKDGRSGTDDIYAQWIDSNGNVYWSRDGTAVCTEANNQKSPQICSDGDGGAFIVWQDERSTNFDIYMQHLQGNFDPNDLLKLILLLTMAEPGILDLLLDPLVLSGIGLAVIVLIVVAIKRRK